MSKKKKIAILGGGNIGLAIVNGLIKSKMFLPGYITLTRKHPEHIEHLKKSGIQVSADNQAAVQNSEIIIIAVQPQQLNDLLDEIKDSLNEKKHLLISVVSGAGIKAIRAHIGKNLNIIRAMPNTAIAIGESMTCLAADKKTNSALKIAENIFSSVGRTLVIDEKLMVPATALCACGTAFFLRAIRAASQGGIEIGFHSEEALLMAAQTAKGAAALLGITDHHPESEVDKVTTPLGCTISGLNQMEHYGFSSAMIRGIVTSAEKAAKLYSVDE